MAALLQKKLGITAELVEGRGGVFKVWANEQLLWDKHAMGDQFPAESMIVEKVEKLNAA